MEIKFGNWNLEELFKNQIWESEFQKIIWEYNDFFPKILICFFIAKATFSNHGLPAIVLQTPFNSIGRSKLHVNHEKNVGNQTITPLKYDPGMCLGESKTNTILQNEPLQ